MSSSLIRCHTEPIAISRYIKGPGNNAPITEYRTDDISVMNGDLGRIYKVGVHLAASDFVGDKYKPENMSCNDIFMTINQSMFICQIQI